MRYLVVGMICVALLCVFDLLLTFGVIRRLREHTALLTKQATATTAPLSVMLQPHDRVAPFEVIADDGGTLSRESLAGNSLVGFFSHDCDACVERMPTFISLAGSAAWRREQVVAVMIGDGAGADRARARLAQVARVVDQKHSTVMTRAFGVVAFPAFCVIDESGTVLTSGFATEDLHAAHS